MSPSYTKPRLGETADEVWAAICEANGGVVAPQGRILYPTLRVIAGMDFQVKSDRTLQIVDDTFGVRDATDAEADEFHRDLDRDTVQVLLLTPPGYASNYGRRRIVRELHSPSGNSFNQKH